MMLRKGLLPALVLLGSALPCVASGPTAAGHPRLFFNAAELKRLRSERNGARAFIWRNLARSADWCMTRPLRKEWIAPVSPDPIYANLYDRFYGMMHDMAVMEHLAFAYAYGGDARYGKAGVEWAMACCRVWQKEADGQPDGGKAYAVTRLIKGLAVSYDLLYDRLSDAQRTELRDTIARLGKSYYDGYFTQPHIAAEAFHTHHATVEWASFGVAALALLGEAPEADKWLAATSAKFRAHLLPLGLAPDGAQVEGSTFWASTMQYRLSFMDALRRVTGEDLIKAFAPQMDARLALASVAAPKPGGHDQDHETVVLEPSYGQLNYYSPVLLALAREYRRPLYQRLALWDKTVGSVQQSRYVTDNGEWMLFDWGGYAYAWYDPKLRAGREPDAPLSFLFPSVNEAYVRASYDARGIVAGQRSNLVAVHAGGRPVFVDHQPGTKPPAPVAGLAVDDDRKRATITCQGAPDSGFTSQSLTLQRPGRLTLTRQTDADQAWWCYGKPARSGNILRWDDGTVLEVKRGTIVSMEPDGYHDEKVVGLGLLRLKDPLPMAYPLVTARPSEGALVVEVRAGRR